MSRMLVAEFLRIPLACLGMLTNSAGLPRNAYEFRYTRVQAVLGPLAGGIFTPARTPASATATGTLRSLLHLLQLLFGQDLAKLAVNFLLKVVQLLLLFGRQLQLLLEARRQDL